MSPTALASLAVIAAYLIGSIPFAYVVVRAAKGVDIRTVGSGNVGATNAGRVLGARGFLLVFLLDLLKGLVPTIALPPLVTRLGHHEIEGLAVLIALATIMGHNFPIYLQFRGGKGVSTSLGATLGLDWVAGLAAAAAFGIALRIWKYVSLASVIGASAFVAVHFSALAWLKKQSAWDRENVALTVLTLGLYAMLVIRHRKNWGRIRAGTEPKIGRRRETPSGRASAWLVVILAAVGIAAVVATRFSRKSTLDCGEFSLVDLGHVKTNHQRAIRPAFGDGGRRLGVLCPRYDRLMIYDVAADDTLQPSRDVTLDGQPMAMVGLRDGFLVLLRPSGDERHIKPGFLQLYGYDGAKAGPRVAVGFYPSDLAVGPDGNAAMVLTQGRAEGNPRLPAPAMEVVDLRAGRSISRVEFAKGDERPVKISACATSPIAAVALVGSEQVAAIDVSDPIAPRVVGRSPLPRRDMPYPSRSGDDVILMPVASDRECAVIPTDDRDQPLAGHLVSVQVDASELDVRTLGSLVSLGTLPLRGAANFAPIRPTGVAVSPERGLIAVTSRSGGVHLVGIRREVGGPREVAARAGLGATTR